MGLFNFLKPKKQELPITFFADRLTLEEKVAIHLTMLFIVSQQGNRQYHTEEMRFIQTIKHSILGLAEGDMKSIKIESFSFISVVNAMSESNKEYFALTFFGLASIVHDHPILKVTSIIVGDMGFTMQGLAEKQAQTQQEIDNNPHMSVQFKTRR